ncbi:hypothetical protein IKF89_02750 [Candidatus Saccharibacteria bacterium]|nr:hypothetical protein [Candidatus Saccharibacteria bacterium]
MDDERKFDPVTPSAQKDIRPDFLGGNGGGEKIGGDKKEAKGVAAGALSEAEGAASGGLWRPEGGMEAAREEEQAARSGFYAGKESTTEKAGRLASAAKDLKKGNFKGVFRKAGPILGIFMVIFAVGGIMAGTQMFQPFSLVAQMQDSFNSMHVSANARSARFFKLQMESGRVKNPKKGTIFGETFKITKKQNEQLKRQGIEFDKDYNGTGIKVLKYNDGSGNIKIVTADEGSASRVGGVSFDKIYASDVKFFDAYNAGSMTWRGQFANWYGTNVSNFLKNNKLTRNMWQNFKEKKEKSGGDGLKVVKETIGKRIGSVEGGGIKRTTETGYDDEGERVKTDEQENNLGFGRGKANEAIDKINKAKGKIQGGVAIGCAIMDFIGVINLIVAASEASQIINLTTAYLEAPDKTKAGYGDDAPIHELTNTLNEKVENKNIVLEPTGAAAGVASDGTIAALTTKEVTTNKTAMDSAGIGGLYGKGKVNPNDPSVQSFNLMSSANTLLGGIGSSVDSFRDCQLAKGAAAIANMGIDLVVCIFTACLGTIFKDAAVGIGLGVGIQVVLSGILAVLTPWLTATLERDLVETLGGEDLGNALASGGLMYMGSVHRANGGSLTTINKYQRFAVTQAEVVAENAKFERQSLSPFDVTSSNTFMGSIMTQMMKFVGSGTLMNTLTSANSVVNSSLVALTPKTSAVAAEIADNLPNMEEYEKTCPYLYSIGAIGDAFCNPYIVTDMGTIDKDPVDVINYLIDAGEVALVDEDGKTVAKEDLGNVKLAVADLTTDGGMRLAAEGDEEEEEEEEKVVNVKISGDDFKNYVEDCDERASPFGVVDQSIVNKYDAGSTGNDIADTIIGGIPFIGDIADVMSSVSTSEHIDDISGQRCVAGGDSWGEKEQNYQRFIEDQSLAESMGIIEKSAVAEYLDEYYKENPIDESYEGQLARYSGLSKETIEDTLAIIDYYNYINEYDASERYAFEGVVDPNEKKAVTFDNEYVMEGEMVLTENIVYADVRNRSFVV